MIYEKDVEKLRKDIDYFKNLGFETLSNKFSSCLSIIEQLEKQIDLYKSKETLHE